MIFPSDLEYIDTKLVKQGHKLLHPIFQQLADWINQKFNTNVLNIYYDKIKEDKNRPRLNIIFEFLNEEEKFKDKVGNFDSIKQKVIADKFSEILYHYSRKKGFVLKLLSKLKPNKYRTKNLYVIFDSFEPVARVEANLSISEDEIEKLKSEIGIEDLWKIYRQYSVATFFFYTDKELERYSSDRSTDILKKKYYNLLKRYDEFNYIHPETFFLKFDTKENFDNNYQGSWFYYSR